MRRSIGLSRCGTAAKVTKVRPKCGPRFRLGPDAPYRAGPFVGSDFVTHLPVPVMGPLTSPPQSSCVVLVVGGVCRPQESAHEVLLPAHAICFCGIINLLGGSVQWCSSEIATFQWVFACANEDTRGTHLDHSMARGRQGS